MPDGDERGPRARSWRPKGKNREDKWEIVGELIGKE